MGKKIAAMTGIKPCPHCGAESLVLEGELDALLAEWGEDGWGQEAILARLREGSFLAVVCPADSGGCGASGPWMPTVSAAMRAWNRRAL